MLLAIDLSSFPPSSGYHEKNIHHMDALNLDSCLWFYLSSHILRMWLGRCPGLVCDFILFSNMRSRLFCCTGYSFFMDGGFPKVQSSMVQWSLRVSPKGINTISTIYYFILPLSIGCRVFLFFIIKSGPAKLPLSTALGHVADASEAPSHSL